jgi:hypothetical protein
MFLVCFNILDDHWDDSRKSSMSMKWEDMLAILLTSLVWNRQWMNPYTQSEAVDFGEQVSWTQAITLEVSLLHLHSTGR